jgi:hypothetical protein
MSMSIAWGSSVRWGIALGILSASCGGSARQEYAAQPTGYGSDRPVERRAIGGGPRDPDHRFRSSVGKIARARCDREMRCGNVGPNEKFATRDECVSRTEAAKRDDINADECMLGVSHTGLVACLDAIREEDCGSPLDSVARLNACRSGNVCLK